MIVRVVLLLLGLASGVLLAAAAFYGVFGPTAPKPEAAAAPPPPPPPPQTMIVVAAKAIPSGTLITFQDLRFAPVAANLPTAADFLRPGAPTPNDQRIADRRVFSEIAGAVSRARFDEGDPIVRGQMVKPGDSGFLAAVLRPGMRAVTMSVNLVTGNAGLLSPGDHVDVVLVQTFPGHDTDPGNRSVAETIATDLRVIAVDQRLEAGPVLPKDSHPAQTVTLEVTPVQAEQIDVGSKMGELALAIRGVQAEPSPGDQSAAPASGPANPTVWAKDLSQAAAGIQPAQGAPAGKGGAPTPASGNDTGKPAVRVIRAEKVETVVLP
jgi:pilus assembly protein CpaB